MTRSDQRLDTPEELYRIAEETFIFGYPLVLMEVTRRRATNVATVTRGRAPMNAFSHARTFPDHNFTAIVRPNADTLYSSLWYDVSTEPLIIDVADSQGRYYVLTGLDMWTDQFFATGTRTTGNGAQRLAIVGPQWTGELPTGTEMIRSPTAQGWLLGRAQTNGPQDFETVHRFQDSYAAAPLSRLGSTSLLPSPPPDPTVDVKIPPPQVLAALSPASFLDLFTQAMTKNLPHANDYPMVHRMQQLGIKPGQRFELSKADVLIRTACEAAWPAAQQRLRRPSRDGAVHGNGWRINLTTIGSYGTDYVRRAAVSYFGLGAVCVEDAVYPSAFHDADGKPLDSGARYHMHFAADKLPPARAFWSLSLYNQRQYFAENPIRRYAIGDRDALQFNADGSLDLFIQREQPVAARAMNWLPAPTEGRFNLSLRLYWPMPQVLDGAWFPPPVLRVG